MDIQGLVNHHYSPKERRFSSLSPQENSGSESTRSQFPGDSVIIPLQSQYPDLPGDREIYPRQHYRIQNSADRETSLLVKRPLDGSSSSLTIPPAKRRNGEIIWENNAKSFPTRRRALQACDACRSKKSKCDNERPSCGSCLQHGVECVYKAGPFVPLFHTARLTFTN